MYLKSKSTDRFSADLGPLGFYLHHREDRLMAAFCGLPIPLPSPHYASGDGVSDYWTRAPTGPSAAQEILLHGTGAWIKGGCADLLNLVTDFLG
ncbi:hypothetical protein NUW58_g8148 [Xylaria curta]|uniref:Uncharacterized protein n=1 Tax=Xylaria curta TaxID=42375 RepID=A0ACC1NA99_9PEZI|nr:hypothetical protein NUW58_g8148 [Xylaria curta]